MSLRTSLCLAIFLPALMLSGQTLPAVAAPPEPQDAQGNDLAVDAATARAGETFTGAPGITETVDEIMARASVPELLERAVDAAPPRQGMRKAPNPFAPRVASWPAAAADEGARTLGPVPDRSPQTPLANFLAVAESESGWLPSDAAGAVGPTQVMVVANGRIKVFDKAGNIGALNVSSDTFFQSVRTTTTTDAHVRYDRLSTRWFVTIQTRECTDNSILLAVSSGPTITGTVSFTFFRFVAEAGRRVDDSTLGRRSQRALHRRPDVQQLPGHST